MALTEYLRILRRWGWILLVMALLTAAAAYVFSKVQTPIYRSSVFISVQPSRPDLGLTESSKTLLRSYVSVINTETFARKVIDVLDLDRLPQSLLGDTTIASDESRFVIQIDVKHTNGDVANDIARTWAMEFVAWRDAQNAQARREDKVEAVILDDPRYSLYRPNTRVNALAGAVLGLLLGGLVIFAVETIESGILRSAGDVERGLGLPVLGSLPPLEGPAPGPRRPGLGRG
jgi:capsular polysaccharide biosynthesis protein